MEHKEYTMIEIMDILRRWLGSVRIRRTVSSMGMDRNTKSKYIRIAKKGNFN